MQSEDETAVRSLYENLIKSWNTNDAAGFARGFAPDGMCIGFDGSEYNSAAETEQELGKIFADHTVATYVSKVRGVQAVAADVALLRAVASMVPSGGHDLNPDRNVLHTLLASKTSGKWEIVLYQNTPAKYDGRPEMTRALTEELRELL